MQQLSSDKAPRQKGSKAKLGSFRGGTPAETRRGIIVLSDRYATPPNPVMQIAHKSASKGGLWNANSASNRRQSCFALN